jgi:hypothetical protein
MQVKTTILYESSNKNSGRIVLVNWSIDFTIVVTEFAVNAALE